MKLNPAKCNYMLFTRAKTQFSTRLSIKNFVIDRVPFMKILGVWISEDMSWAKNCQQICRKAYSRLSMITKLKYVGVPQKDLIDIYILFIRSVTEYCSASFHSSLTKGQSNKLEKIQKTCLKVILGDHYIDYPSALEVCNLQTLSERRASRCLSFAKKSINHPTNNRLFPKNPNSNIHSIRKHEPFKVNFARTSEYRKSTIPYCQRLLNEHFSEQ